MKKVYALYFSPTGGTAGIAGKIAGDMAAVLDLPLEKIDFTLPDSRARGYSFSDDELVVIACPTYAGRIPNKVLPDFESDVKGSGKTPAVIVSVYGGRSDDECLRELTLLSERNGFIPIAAAECVARHSMSHVMSAGRPDENDYDSLRVFAEIAAEKAVSEAPSAVAVDRETPIGPYYRPLKEDGSPAVFLKAKPLTDMQKCTRCGTCAKVCPMGSISREDPAAVEGVCIKCHACVRSCPVQAKYFDDAELLSHIRALEKTYTARRDNIYLF